MSEHETPAETIRRAIEQMRARAEKATSAPWRLGEHAEYGPMEAWGNDDGWNASMVATTKTRLNPQGSPRAAADAEHIASWHPAAALAVAELLERLLDIHDPVTDPDGDTWCIRCVRGPVYMWPCGEIEGVVRLARTYLGETP